MVGETERGRGVLLISTSTVRLKGLQTFEIDRVLEVRTAPAKKAGGTGDRFTVKIKGKTTHLYFERSASVAIGAPVGRWFVERA